MSARLDVYTFICGHNTKSTPTQTLYYYIFTHIGTRHKGFCTRRTLHFIGNQPIGLPLIFPMLLRKPLSVRRRRGLNMDATQRRIDKRRAPAAVVPCELSKHTVGVVEVKSAGAFIHNDITHIHRVYIGMLVLKGNRQRCAQRCL